MAGGTPSETLLQQFQVLLAAGAVGSLTDAELVDRFLRHRGELAEAAFAALMERHGPMVLRVCEMSLKDHHAAQDAFQATFLVLARHAGSIRKHHSVASWLFGVARRSSSRLRTAEARRRRYERDGAAPVDVEACAVARTDIADGFPELHAEIDRLPGKYQLPIVLCYLEGLTHEQAACRLCWPVGTVKTRLARGREQLRSRLKRRGWAGQPIILGTGPAAGNLAGHVQTLLRPTVQAAARLVSGASPAGLVSTTVLTTTQGVSRAMLIHKSRLAAVILCGMLGAGLGALALAQRVAGKGPDVPSKDDRPNPATIRLVGRIEYHQATVTQIHSPLSCHIRAVRVGIGEAVKKGDPLLEIFSPDLAAAKGEYETALGQHARDKSVLKNKEPLAKTGTLPLTELLDAQNDEAKSSLQVKLARARLLVLGLPPEELDKIAEEEGTQKARMTLRSPVDGIVIRRNVVVGNYYEPKDELMQISPLDPMNVTAAVSENLLDRIHPGLEILVSFPSFPFDGYQRKATVQSVDPTVNPETGTFLIRTSVPNADHRLKAGMFVHVLLPPASGPKPEPTPRPAGERSSDAALNQRLDIIERKLDRILGEKPAQTSKDKILERVNELERKVDRLSEAREQK